MLLLAICMARFKTPDDSQVSLLAGLGCGEHGAQNMGHGASPNLHQEPTEAPRGWLRSASAASALSHNAQLVLLHPSTSWTRIDSKGQREQGPTHPPQWWDRGSAPTSGASERRYENEAAAPKKKPHNKKEAAVSHHAVRAAPLRAGRVW